MKKGISVLAMASLAILTMSPANAENKVVEARKRLTDALEKSQAVWESARAKAVEGAKATDEAIRSNPYRALGCALGVGVVIGLVLGRRRG